MATDQSPSPLDPVAVRTPLGGQVPDDVSSQPLQPQPMERAPSGSPESDRNPTAEGQIEFDEEWYLDQNPDVARAIAEDGRGTALGHYTIHGRREGRLPVPPTGWIKNAAQTRDSDP